MNSGAYCTQIGLLPVGGGGSAATVGTCFVHE